jgi:uncharacterized protein YegL
MQGQSIHGPGDSLDLELDTFKYQLAMEDRNMSDRPGGALAKRPLHFIYVVDTSGSMAGKKMESLNLAVRESIKPMQDEANENPNADVLIRVLRFSGGAQWHFSQPTNIHDFRWLDLDADAGETRTGQAMRLLADALSEKNMPSRGLPPVVLLITDGMPTDAAEYQAGLKSLLSEPWGKRSVRIGLAIGDDADTASIEQFIANPEVKPLRADNVQDLVKKVRWASTVLLKAASSPTGSSSNGGVPIPSAPSDAAAVSAGDVF